ncbi:hypothetical protein ACIBHX_30700 [Nonomuraea sp. NPDC050536]
MLGALLGTAWMLFGPLAIYAFVRGPNLNRAAAVAAFVLLEMATVAYT